MEKAEQGEKSESQEEFFAKERLEELREECEKLKYCLERNMKGLCEIEGSDDVKEKISISEKELPRYIEGQRCTLSELESKLKQRITIEGTFLDMKSTILNLASRKYYGPRDEKAVEVNLFEDVSLGPYWFWEIRANLDIPENIKKDVKLARKQRKQIQERLQAICDFLKIHQEYIGDSVKNKKKGLNLKVHKALDKLNRVSKFSELLQDPQDRAIENIKDEDEPSKLSGSLKIEEKMGFAKNQAKEVKRDSVASGFGSIKELQNAQKMFKNFFIETPKKDGDQEIHTSQTISTTIHSHSFLGMCPENKKVQYHSGDVDLLDKNLRRNWTFEEIEAEFKSLIQNLRDIRSRNIPVAGEPPSWAKIPNTKFDFSIEARKVLGDTSFSFDNLKTSRKKYLWYKSDTDCPPYYGQWPPNNCAKKRDPFKIIEGLDYEEFFDEGWEEGEDGESLSGEDDEEEEVLEDNDVLHDFVVEDGYLSEDEGMKDTVSETPDKKGNFSLEFGISSKPCSNENTLLALNKHIQKFKKTGVPFIAANIALSNISKCWNVCNANFLDGLKIEKIGNQKISIPGVHKRELKQKKRSLKSDC